MSDITLSAGVRQNLLSLQKTADMMSTTQNRLATGKRVNTALDNPNNFFTSSALQSRAGDLNALLDSMSVGIKTLEAADNGLTAINKTVESMQSTLRQARQDKSFKTASYTFPSTRTGNITFSGGSIGATPVTVNMSSTPLSPASVTAAGGTSAVGDPDYSALAGKSVTVTAGGQTATYVFTSATTGQKAALQAAFAASGFTVTGTAAGLDISRTDGVNFTVDSSVAAVATAIGIP